jgi:hypothetical protein
VKVAAVSELGAWSASTRYRLLQHLDRLGDRIGPIDMLLPDDQPERRPGRWGQITYFGSHTHRYGRRTVDLARRLPRYDAVLVQRGVYSIGPGLAALPIEWHRGRVVFDLDDDVFSPKPSIAAKSPAARWLYGPQQARRVLARADRVVVSTAVLRDALPPPHLRPATVLPTVPDPSKYAVATHQDDHRLIGWAGTNGGLPYLDPLREVLGRLRAEGTGRMQVVSSQPWDGPSEFRPWQLEEESTLFSDFAVGIMPLPDTDYTRAKAGFKLLQYMAAGVPVVASPIGVNTQLVRDSDAGILAGDPSEWEEALRMLLSSAKMRQRLGSNGRAFVTAYADMDHQADVLADLLTAR